MKLTKIFIKLIGFLAYSFYRLFRMLLIGVLSALVVTWNIDHFTKPAYGEINIVIIVSAFVFFPVFVTLFVEFLISEFVKRKNNKKVKTSRSNSYKNI